MKAGMIIGFIAGTAVSLATVYLCQSEHSKKCLLRKGKKFLREYTDLL
ncbi:MAG: hypothetical protein KIG36_05060 [Eubacteriales bacterium]|nr:hypothetical protein [Eubacteriales bacterium]